MAFLDWRGRVALAVGAGLFAAACGSSAPDAAERTGKTREAISVACWPYQKGYAPAQCTTSVCQGAGWAQDLGTCSVESEILPLLETGPALQRLMAAGCGGAHAYRWSNPKSKNPRGTRNFVICPDTPAIHAVVAALPAGVVARTERDPDPLRIGDYVPSALACLQPIPCGYMHVFLEGCDECVGPGGCGSLCSSLPTDDTASDEQ